MRIPLIIGLATALLYFAWLGDIPLVDSSEGFHVSIAWEMATRGDWITPHFDGFRYFDKPPLLYWLMAATFKLVGPSDWSARLWSVLAVVGVAMLTAWLGTRLGSNRLGLIAGSIVTVNLGVFLFGHFAKPDLLFIFFIVLAFAGFVAAYQTASWRALLVCCAGMGAAAMAKDPLGVLGPLVVFGLFLGLTRTRLAVSRWAPWAGVGLLILLTVPWHVAMELRNPGFLRYMLIDNHVLNVARSRAFPDEDVPLGVVEFVGATALFFFPWSLALPWALRRALRPPWRTEADRLWFLVQLWAVGFLAVIILSPFRLPHYGLPAFPALALLVAKVWDDVWAGREEAPSLRALLTPPLVMLSAFTVVGLAAWGGRVLVPLEVLSTVDLYGRNLGAQGQPVPFISYEQLYPWLPVVVLIFGGGSVALALSLRRGRPSQGLIALLAAMIAFFPVTVQGLRLLIDVRSPRPIIEFLKQTVGPDDVVVHEGALENTGSLPLALAPTIKIVNGLRSNLAFGATFPEAREGVWSGDRLRREWAGGRRIFLVSVEAPERSVANGLSQDRLCLLIEAGGRRLFANQSVGTSCALLAGRLAPSPLRP